MGIIGTISYGWAAWATETLIAVDKRTEVMAAQIDIKSKWRELMAMSRSQMSKQVTKPGGKLKGVPKGLTYLKRVAQLQKNQKVVKFVLGKAWAKRTFDTYPSAYANMAASKYCKDPNYAKGAKGKKKKK